MGGVCVCVCVRERERERERERDQGEQELQFANTHKGTYIDKDTDRHRPNTQEKTGDETQPATTL